MTTEEINLVEAALLVIKASLSLGLNDKARKEIEKTIEAEREVGSSSLASHLTVLLDADAKRKVALTSVNQALLLFERR
jgi:hypothetical protein